MQNVKCSSLNGSNYSSFLNIFQKKKKVLILNKCLKWQGLFKIGTELFALRLVVNFCSLLVTVFSLFVGNEMSE